MSWQLPEIVEVSVVYLHIILGFIIHISNGFCVCAYCSSSLFYSEFLLQEK